MTAESGGFQKNIGGVVVTTTGTTFDLTDSKLSWTAEKYYTLSVRATGATNSLWSDEQDIRYVAMFSTLSYGPPRRTVRDPLPEIRRF